MVTTMPAAIPMTKTTALKLELQNCSSVIGTVGTIPSAARLSTQTAQSP